VKAKELFYLLGLRPKAQSYGCEIKTFDLGRDGRIEYAQWLHPRETAKQITQESVAELRRFLSEGDVAIDIGAHTGDSTIPMALAVGKSGCVLALEPNSHVYPVLAKNAELNPGKTRIIPLPFAATPEDAELVFQYSDAGYCNGGRFAGISRWTHGHAFQLRVQGKNLLSFLQAQHPELIPKIRYIKIDTEGNDEAVIQSIPELLSRYKPFLRIEMYRKLSEEQRRSLFRSVSSLGYTLHRIVDEDNYRGDLVLESDLNRWKHFDAFCVPVTQA
jgi:FkbM family methyltransferase